MVDLGLIIDGTGKDYDKITNQARQLEALGYDTHMIFVNTSLDVALQRNAERPRKLAEPLVVQSWNDVQKNIGKFNNYFQGNFIIIDNNDAKEDVFTQVFKRIKKLANKRIQNKRAQQWIGVAEETQRGIWNRSSQDQKKSCRKKVAQIRKGGKQFLRRT